MQLHGLHKPIWKKLEYFDKQIFITDDSYYKVVWFIDQLKEQIKEYGIKSVDVPTDLLTWEVIQMK